MKQVPRAMVLGQKFFNRTAIKVARELLGKFLCRRASLRRRTSKCYMVTETEAYVGPEDKASHAHRGKTLRNTPMFGPAGRWYVYFTYGMHWMLNIVTGSDGYPAAVLIRALGSPTSPGSMTSVDGPGRVTKFLKIDRRFNDKRADKKIGLWIENHGIKIKKHKIKSMPRVGVDYAGKWAKKPLRFTF